MKVWQHGVCKKETPTVQSYKDITVKARNARTQSWAFHSCEQLSPQAQYIQHESPHPSVLEKYHLACWGCNFPSQWNPKAGVIVHVSLYLPCQIHAALLQCHGFCAFGGGSSGTLMSTRVFRFSRVPFLFLTPLLPYSSGFCFVSPGLEHGSPLTSVCASSHSPFLPDENANLILPCPKRKLIQCLCQQKDSLLDPNLLFMFIPQSTQVNSLLQSQPIWVVQFHLCVFSSREILQFWVALSFPLPIFIFFSNIFIYECIHLFGWTGS